MSDLNEVVLVTGEIVPAEKAADTAGHPIVVYEQNGQLVDARIDDNPGNEMLALLNDMGADWGSFTRSQRKLLKVLRDNCSMFHTHADLYRAIGINKGTFYKALQDPKFKAVWIALETNIMLTKLQELDNVTLKKALNEETSTDKDRELAYRRMGIIRKNAGDGVVVNVNTAIKNEVKNESAGLCPIDIELDRWIQGVGGPKRG